MKMKFFITILCLHFFGFANAQVPGTPSFRKVVFPKFSLTVTINSASSVNFIIDVTASSGSITEVGVVYGIAKELTTGSTLCNQYILSFGTRVGTFSYTNNEWASTINITVLSTSMNALQTSFYVAPYYARLYAVKDGTYFYGPNIEFLPNWPTVTETSTNKVWSKANLGALQVATSMSDANSYGWYYQWGKPTDGHQFKNSPVTGNKSTSDIPTAGQFYANGDNYWQQTTVPFNNNVFNGNSNLWNGVNGINNPCPSGWRLPTVAEWTSFVNGNITSQGDDESYNSVLKLPRQGVRSKNGTYYTYESRQLDMTSSYWSGDASKPGWSWMHMNGGPGYRTSDDGLIGVVGTPPPYGYGRFTANGEAVRCVQN